MVTLEYSETEIDNYLDQKDYLQMQMLQMFLDDFVHQDSFEKRL